MKQKVDFFLSDLKSWTASVRKNMHNGCSNSIGKRINFKRIQFPNLRQVTIRMLPSQIQISGST